MTEIKTQPLIENCLPQQFIYDLGLYLQTCAHIEVTVCDLICRAEGLETRSNSWLLRFNELRKQPIKDLVVELRSVRDRIVEICAEDFTEFINWIDQYKLNRHIAAHGAFFQNVESGGLKVLYTHKRKVNGEVSYTEEETTISRELILSLIEDADRILRILVGIILQIEQGILTVKNTSSL